MPPLTLSIHHEKEIYHPYKLKYLKISKWHVPHTSTIQSNCSPQSGGKWLCWAQKSFTLPDLSRGQRTFPSAGNWEEARKSNHFLLAQLSLSIFNWMEYFLFHILQCRRATGNEACFSFLQIYILWVSLATKNEISTMLWYRASKQ